MNTLSNCLDTTQSRVIGAKSRLSPDNSWPTLGLHHEACKCVYVRILISETSTNKKYEEKMHIEVSETIFLRLFQ